MKVLNEHFIFDKLIQGYSLSRFGDGEFKMLRGDSGISRLQEFNEMLKQKLLKIFLNPLSKLLIGLPNPLGTRPYVVGFYKHFDRFILDKPAKEESIFVSSFFTRPSLVNIDSDEYFERAKNVWKDREVVLVNFNPDLLDHFLFRDSFCNFIDIPRRDCFSEYEGIMASCYRFCGKNKMFLVSAGPVANCIVYDLCERGEQAIDVGQFAFEYSLFKGDPNPERWTSQCVYKVKRGYLRGVND